MARSDALDSEYESAVADVLAFLAGDRATVERNVYLYGRRSKAPRQIDVVVRRRTFGAEATLVVDCKRWAKRLDVADVGSFLSVVEDVGADQGLLVSTKGASEAAMQFAHEARGVRLDVMGLDELQRWSPPGTVTTEYRIPCRTQSDASRALRRAGFRVTPSAASPPAEDQVTLQIFRHYGFRSPPAEVQTEQWEQAKAAMAKAGVTDPMLVSHGITVMGGTPAHQWLEVDFHGVPIGLKICAATEAEAEGQMESVRQHVSSTGIPSHELTYLRRQGWPVEGLFGGWPQG
jgi:hypothetical protein